jgi:anaerobic magnesium-protoporphyrin IX monomethyl ester cyclase
MERYLYEFMGRRFAVLEASRGCPFKCSFCYLGMYGRGYRQKSLERVIREVEETTGRYGVRNIYFMDLEFGLDRDFLLNLCSELEREAPGLKWCCQTRVSSVDRESLEAMARAGCSLIHFGVEAGSPRILAETGKGITVEMCERAVRLCREFEIRTALFMNFGFPGESQEEMEETIALAVRLNPTYAAFHLIVPFPGTELARKTGLDPDELPANLYPQYNAAGHDLVVLKRMLRKAYLKFYLRPSYLCAAAGKGGRMLSTQVRVFTRMVFG